MAWAVSKLLGLIYYLLSYLPASFLYAGKEHQPDEHAIAVLVAGPYELHLLVPSQYLYLRLLPLWQIDR